MQNFIYDIATQVYFGKNQIENLPAALIRVKAKKILLVYGGGSIKRNGIYEQITRILEQAGVIWQELSAIQPNPRVSTVELGVKICRAENCEAVLAVGGGSCIDAAKLIATAVFYRGPAWDIVKDPGKISRALPIVTVVTMAATGSEMNTIAVISNWDTKEKIGTRHELMRPQVSFLDPTYTFSVDKYQTAAGVVDIMSHILENYFSRHNESFIQDKMCEGLLKACIKYGPLAIEQPDNYEARANLMWAASWAINGSLSLGKADPWSCHSIEHQLSAYYDITHGAGLAIIIPHWMEFVLNKTTREKFAEYGVNVWDIDSTLAKDEIAKLAILRTKLFFAKLGMPKKLRDLEIDAQYFTEMSEKAATAALKNAYVSLDKNDVFKIYQLAL